MCAALGPRITFANCRIDKASEMADEIIARALNKFRDKVLRPGGWSPTGGASLNTMFITQCILQFPNVYRHWLVENKRPPAVHDGLEELEFMVAGPDSDPAGLVVIREEIAHALEHYVKDPRVTDALILKAWGYAMREIAEMLGVTKKALDGVLQRHWRKLRGSLRMSEKGERHEGRDRKGTRREFRQASRNPAWQKSTGSSGALRWALRLRRACGSGLPPKQCSRSSAARTASATVLSRSASRFFPLSCPASSPITTGGSTTAGDGRCPAWTSDSVVKYVAKAAKDLAATALGLDLPSPSIGIGLQLGGPVDTRTGTVIRYENNPTDPAILKPEQRYLWEDEKLAELVEQKPAAARCSKTTPAAFAAVEQKFGVGQEHSTFAVILIRDGVGCSMVMENKLLPGPWELGHIIVWPDGRECECGLVGDIESQAGRRAIRAVVARRKSASPEILSGSMPSSLRSGTVTGPTRHCAPSTGPAKRSAAASPRW